MDIVVLNFKLAGYVFSYFLFDILDDAITGRIDYLLDLLNSAILFFVKGVVVIELLVVLSTIHKVFLIIFIVGDGSVEVVPVFSYKPVPIYLFSYYET